LLHQHAAPSEPYAKYIAAIATSAVVSYKVRLKGR
jgi:hypothetical protein